MSTRQNPDTWPHPRPTGFPSPGAGRAGLLFAALWLVYLSYPWSVAWSSQPGAPRTLSLLSVILFGAVYLTAIMAMGSWRRAGAPGRGMPYGWAYIVGEGVLVAGMSLAAHETSFAGFVFMAVTAVFILTRPAALVVVVVLGGRG